MSLSPELQEQTRNVIATMLRVSSEEVAAGTSLASLNTSLGSAKVRLGLKRLGLALPPGSAPATFGGLLAALSGDDSSVPGAPSDQPASPASAAAPRAVVSSAAGGALGLQVGLDVEDIRSLPVATDYWEHGFYRTSFARSEIAYAVLHMEPRTHFAGFWCAKEALRKCDPSFAAISLDRTAVAHDPDGRPYITLETEAGIERLGHAVSISHTTEVATAVVVSIPAAAVLVAAPAPVKTEAVEAPVPEAKKSRGLAKLFGI
jgi:phosphopantetheine--protein transferase-like protein